MKPSRKYIEAKIQQALSILQALGLPKAQQNKRSALTLLALMDIKPRDHWADAQAPLIGVTPIMDWIREHYRVDYAPNTRETIRRQTLHQFLQAGLVRYNPDKPDRPVNSPQACYQIEPHVKAVIQRYEEPGWRELLVDYLSKRETLQVQYAMRREMEMVPLTILMDERLQEVKLSPGAHSELIQQIITEFGPRFAPGAEILYIGDTGAKEVFFRGDRLAALGVQLDRKSKLPDVVLYLPDKNWLILAEAVTSHGPVDSKRMGELSDLFRHAQPGLVFLTAFPDRETMRKYLSEISWESEVWVADAPSHMIHFNGKRFLGPYESE